MSVLDTIKTFETWTKGPVTMVVIDSETVL
jgi:hypothetical protein